MSKKKDLSFRDSMLGKATIDGLPENFFEKVLDCEIRLKQKFSYKILQELVNYYTMAIEYFESIDDPRYKQYNQNLNLLFTQPEVARYINGKQFRKLEKKESIKKKLAESELTVTKKKVETVLKKTKTVDDLKGMINDEISIQKSNFQKRKEEKKKKMLLSTSDITGAIDSIRNKRNQGPDNMNKSVDDEISEGILGEIDDKGSESSPVKSNSGLKRNKFGLNMDIFFNEFYEYFTYNLIPDIVEKYNNVYAEKLKNETDISVNYLGRIKEMEYLLTNDTEDNYKEEIKKSISNLQEEEKKEKEKNEKKYEEILKNIENDIMKNIPTNTGVNLIQEKFKLDMCNSISSTFK